MAKKKVTLTNTSIRSGVTSDASKAICEYIWNGFDAHAQHVSIVYEANEVGKVLSLKVIDDGEGISRSTLNETFGHYQDSVKTKSFQWSSQVKGHKGKGRYAFNCFASDAKWISVFKEGNNHLKHTISISSAENDRFNDHADDGSLHTVNDEETGTEVQFLNVTLNAAFFESAEFINYLQREFAVFLKLNESRSYSLDVNGRMVDYDAYIAESDVKEIAIHDDKLNVDYSFILTFIRWNEKMKENYCVYYLNAEDIERYEETTRLNKKDTGFHHSVYVSSPYFEYFAVSTKTDDGSDEQQTSLQLEGVHPTKNEKDRVFKELKKRVSDCLAEKQKQYIAEIGGKTLWDKYEKTGIVELPKNEYEEPLYYELRNTVISIYSVQPKIFQNLKNNQAKAMVGCIKLLLQTDKRDDIITILEGITKMTEDERHKLAQILETTELANITMTIDMLENRLKTVSALKAMVFDKSLNAYEVVDVQRMVESAFWLFGEQYNIVTEAEPDFQQALEAYLKKIHKSKKTKGFSKSKVNAEKMKHPDVNKEMDIFAFRQNKESQTIENIVVELKRPNVDLGEVEVSQVKTYMGLIYSEDQFNSPDAQWTFVLVGNKFDKTGYIERELKSNQAWGRKNLIQHVDDQGQHYDIYVRSWSSIFDDFELRHKFLLDKLNLKRKQLTARYKNKQDLHDIVEQSKEA